jgi:hypothetical protein
MEVIQDLLSERQFALGEMQTFSDWQAGFGLCAGSDCFGSHII